jgi:Fungal specific transcription factor domain
MVILHPPANHVPIYWKAYKDNVDPLFKLAHTPTREKQVLQSASQLTSLSRHMECIMFSTYYAAVTSMSETDCLVSFGENKTDLLARYKFANEQALARADFLRTDSVYVLQAITLFLLCMRKHEDSRYIWSMSAIAVRMAQGLGVHRDGSHYTNLTPFKQEMRRRLWWTVMQLDLRSSEDLGTDLAFYEMMSDAKLPRNLNDEDITPDMTELPESRKGGTDITVSC